MQLTVFRFTKTTKQVPCQLVAMAVSSWHTPSSSALLAEQDGIFPFIQRLQQIADGLNGEEAVLHHKAQQDMAAIVRMRELSQQERYNVLHLPTYLLQEQHHTSDQEPENNCRAVKKHKKEKNTTLQVFPEQMRYMPLLHNLPLLEPKVAQVAITTTMQAHALEDTLSLPSRH